MRKIISLLSTICFACSLFAATTNVKVSVVNTSLENGRIDYMLYNEDATIMYVFPIYLAEGETDVELGKTYTEADMKPTYMYWWNPSTYAHALYTECTFVKTVNAAGQVRIDAQVADTNDDIWILLYDESATEPAPQGGTYVADNFSTSYYPSDKEVEYVLTFTEAKLVFVFDLFVEENKADIEPDVTYTLSSVDSRYSKGFYNISTQIIYQSVSFLKHMNADGSYQLTIVVVDTDGNTWNLSVSVAAPADPTQAHLEYDTENADFNHSFVSYEEEPFLSSGLINVYVYDIQNGYYANLYFWLRSGDTTLEPGVYTINDTYGPGTVLASSGVGTQGVAPSFVSTLIEEDGQYYPSVLWFLEAGTVTVSEDGKITIDARNSFNRTVNAVLYPSSQQGFEHVLDPNLRVNKVLHDGHLLIRKGSSIFNANGSRIQ